MNRALGKEAGLPVIKHYSLHVMPQDRDQEAGPFLNYTLVDLCSLDQTIGCYHRDHKLKNKVRGLAEDWEMSDACVWLCFCPWDNTNSMLLL